MKAVILLLVVVCVGCGMTSWVSNPNDPNNVTIEKEIHKELKKPTGELTKSDLEKVTELTFFKKQLTDVKGLEKLTQLTRLILQNNQLTSVKDLEKLTQLLRLDLRGNPKLTRSQIAELQKAFKESAGPISELLV